MRQNPNAADLWRRELGKLDRRIMSERTTPEQKKELWQRRKELLMTAFPSSPDELNKWCIKHLQRSHEQEAERLNAEFINYAKGLDDDSILSTTDRGMLITSVDKEGFITHSWYGSGRAEQ